MHWGKGILISIIVFITGTAVMIAIAMNSPGDLVMKNYYERGIKYQEQIDKINRTNALGEKVKIELVYNRILITMPSNIAPGRIKGDILFYRPSNAAEDFRMLLKIDTAGSMTISTDKLGSGFWKLQLNWNIDSVGYFNETSFTIK